MTLNTLKIAKRMEAAGMPRQQSEALADALDDEVTSNFVTNTDLGVAVDRLETKIEGVEQRLTARIDGVEQRLEAKIDAVAQRLDARIDSSLVRVENTMWKVGFAMLGGSLAIGGLLLRFVR